MAALNITSDNTDAFLIITTHAQVQDNFIENPINYSSLGLDYNLKLYIVSPIGVCNFYSKKQLEEDVSKLKVNINDVLSNKSENTFETMTQNKISRSNFNPAFPFPEKHIKYNEFQKYKKYYTKRHRRYTSNKYDLQNQIINKTYMISDEEYDYTGLMYKFILILKNKSGIVEENDITRDLCEQHSMRFLQQKMRLVNFSSVLQYVQQLKEIYNFNNLYCSDYSCGTIVDGKTGAKIMNSNVVEELMRTASNARPANNNGQGQLLFRNKKSQLPQTLKNNKRKRDNLNSNSKPTKNSKTNSKTKKNKTNTNTNTNTKPRRSRRSTKK